MNFLRRVNRHSSRDLVMVVLPLAALVVAGFWLASRFIQPAPPDTLILASGGAGGAYQRFAAVYKAALAEYGIRVVEKPSAGALENLTDLRDENVEIEAGFYQGGVGQPSDNDRLLSLGALYYEPLWIFYREGLAKPAALDRIAQLKGRRIAVDGTGSGTRHLAMELLRANGIDSENARLVDTGGLKLVDAFARKRIDAAFVVGPTQSATVWALLYTPGVRLMSLTHADAYARHFPHLAKVVLPRGAVDMARDVPHRDVTLVAAAATLLVRKDTHPALVGLLAQVASVAHGGGGVFHKPGEFPKAAAVDFPLSKEAERFYTSGKPFLQRFLPFWAATLVDRMVVMLIPVFALLIPVFRIAPGLYSWRVRSRVYRRYGELKFLEAEVEDNPAKCTPAEWQARLDAIEQDVNRIHTPLAYADMLYTLRSHIALVRTTVAKRAGATGA